MKELKLNLQFFAESGEGNSDQNAGDNNQGQQNNQQPKKKTQYLKAIFNSKAYQKTRLIKP